MSFRFDQANKKKSVIYTLSFISLLLNTPTAIKLFPVSGVQIVTEMYEDVYQSIREGQEKNYTYFLLRQLHKNKLSMGRIRKSAP